MGGNASRSYFSTVYESWTHPEFCPPVTEKPKNDPQFGFSEERQPRGELFWHVFLLRMCLKLKFVWNHNQKWRMPLMKTFTGLRFIRLSVTTVLITWSTCNDVVSRIFLSSASASTSSTNGIIVKAKSNFKP